MLHCYMLKVYVASKQDSALFKDTVEPPKRERFGTRPLYSLFRGCLLSEVAHFYHATAPNYRSFIHCCTFLWLNSFF